MMKFKVSAGAIKWIILDKSSDLLSFIYVNLILIDVTDFKGFS